MFNYPLLAEIIVTKSWKWQGPLVAIQFKVPEFIHTQNYLLSLIEKHLHRHILLFYA